MYEKHDIQADLIHAFEGARSSSRKARHLGHRHNLRMEGNFIIELHQIGKSRKNLSTADLVKV